MSQMGQQMKKSGGAMRLALIAGLFVLSFTGCSHESLTPQSSDVKASKEAPPADCKEISKVTGTTRTAHETAADALEDLKKDASNRGANYVQIEQYSDYGTSVTGRAFRCP